MSRRLLVSLLLLHRNCCNGANRDTYLERLARRHACGHCDCHELSANVGVELLPWPHARRDLDHVSLRMMKSSNTCMFMCIVRQTAGWMTDRIKVRIVLRGGSARWHT